MRCCGLMALGFQTLPSVCWVPLALLWFGQTETAMLFVVIMGTVWSVLIATDNGVRNVPHIYTRAAQTMGMKRLDLVDQKVVMDMDGREVAYEFEELDELVPAFAISVHKSQGNEYPCVIVPVLTQHFVLLQRNLLYTAITRGKKLVILVGSAKALAIAVRNDKTATRHSRLRERLRRDDR